MDSEALVSPPAKKGPARPVEGGCAEFARRAHPGHGRERFFRLPVAPEPEERLPESHEQLVPVGGHGGCPFDDVGREPVVGRPPRITGEERSPQAKLVRGFERPPRPIDEDGGVLCPLVVGAVVERAVEVRLRLHGVARLEGERARPDPGRGCPRRIPLAARVIPGDPARAVGVPRLLVRVGKRRPAPAREVEIPRVQAPERGAHLGGVAGGREQLGQEEGPPVRECGDESERGVGPVSRSEVIPRFPRVECLPQPLDRCLLHTLARRGLGEEGREPPSRPRHGAGTTPGLGRKRRPGQERDRCPRSRTEKRAAPPPRTGEPSSRARRAGAVPHVRLLIHWTPPVPPHPDPPGRCHQVPSPSFPSSRCVSSTP